MKILILLVLFFTVTDLSAQTEDVADTRIVPKDYDENYAFDNPDERKIFLKLTKELRCPMCQNQNIADSDAMIAHDMRRKVYQLMQEGNNESQVIDFMKVRYGDFVHYRPPVNSATIWLWATPILFVLLMATLFVFRRRPKIDHAEQTKLAEADDILNKLE